MGVVTICLREYMAVIFRKWLLSLLRMSFIFEIMMFR